MIDKETTLPIQQLDKCPWNSKSEIHGVYRAGLRGSLEYFKVCDRLKVWPNPESPGRYYILNGNQRIDIIIDIKHSELICEHFGLNPDDEYSPDPAVSKEFRGRMRSIKSDPENQKLIQNFHAKVMQSKIDVMVMDRLDPEDARIFVATYDRNQAKFDEAKLVNRIVDEIQTKNQEIIKRMIRPERAYIQPLVKPVVPHTPTLAPGATDPMAPGDVVTVAPQPAPPEDYGKWGPPPPREPEPALKPSLIPFVVSLTPSGHKEITETILRCSARIFREKTILAALKNLESNLETGDLDQDSIIVEIALLTTNSHLAVAESKKS